MIAMEEGCYRKWAAQDGLDGRLSSSFKGRIFSEKYWYYFHCPKNVLCCILSFVF